MKLSYRSASYEADALAVNTSSKAAKYCGAIEQVQHPYTAFSEMMLRFRGAAYWQ